MMDCAPKPETGEFVLFKVSTPAHFCAFGEGDSPELFSTALEAKLQASGFAGHH